MKEFTVGNRIDKLDVLTPIKQEYSFKFR